MLKRHIRYKRARTRRRASSSLAKFSRQDRKQRVSVFPFRLDRWMNQLAHPCSFPVRGLDLQRAALLHVYMSAFIGQLSMPECPSVLARRQY